MPKDNGKEGYFGGLPTDLFNQLLAFLQGTASAGSAASAPALSVLVSLAQSEHAAAASTVEVRLMDAVFKIMTISSDFALVQNASGGALPGALATLKGDLDDLTKLWSGA
jgi:hypothetical protein